ncbi:uncharacterized protein LOC142979138 [Anticarsia gemmatalis]|uniref:uncharacterized protein LOC142979138 n=1 Tax=Anticarsia gemmatalis TaxID=129554 RepID=UPI003F7726F3
MTRFARARGSKSSNERAPEDSTPWEVMKEQLLKAKQESNDSVKRKEAEQKRIENYENFLKDQKVQKRKATWCDFPENEQKKNDTKLSDSNEPLAKKKKNNKKNTANVAEEPKNTSVDNKGNDKEETNSDNVGKKSKKKKNKTKQLIQPQNDIQTSNTAPIEANSTNKKKNQKKQNFQSGDKVQNNTLNEPNVNEQSKQQKFEGKPPKNKKNKKLVDGKPVRRKEINDNSFQLIINGKEVELVRFDGFPVMKKDAERLKELKDNMIKKGIPKSEVQRTMKLERRRAEKALARVKRDVCYNCRKGGHVLSDCPELKSKIPGADGADGVCFKCGSTEHRQFECKVQRDKEFRFATCFICKEPGHIARQCPDNPKGLYPNGGNCKLCGDVTHLRKDCPTVMDKKEGSTVKLQTLDSGENIEDVGQQFNKVTPTETIKKPKKITF